MRWVWGKLRRGDTKKMRRVWRKYMRGDIKKRWDEYEEN